MAADRFRRETGISAHAYCEGNTASLPLRTATEVVRIVQEALVNVRKHSRARHVLVRLSGDSGRWSLTIEDDGRGFEVSPDGSGGTTPTAAPAMIRERARSIGGEVSVQSAPGTGARVHVQFDA
jgi:signal transduction histidine kinase